LRLIGAFAFLPTPDRGSRERTGGPERAKCRSDDSDPLGRGVAPLRQQRMSGLSMDYHVFILSRVKELYDRGMATDKAVQQGISTTAGTVTSAAIVMVAVFLVFVTLPSSTSRTWGSGSPCGADRRDEHPRRAAAGGDEGAGRLELVSAQLARMAAADWFRRRRGSACGAGG
jgi:hypothetical protein